MILDIGGRTEYLPAGKVLSLSNAVTYADTTDGNVAAVDREVRAGVPWREAVHRIIMPVSAWLDRCVTYPDRDLFFRSMDLGPSDFVLDIGSGWGQLAIPLAHRTRVCALEPKHPKVALQQAIAEQEGVRENLWLVNAPYQEVRFRQPFQMAILNGVLEWVGQFAEGDPHQAQLHFLEKLRGDLAAGGRCVIGIENRIGLKYLLGAADDHTGVPLVSIYDRHLAGAKFQAQTGRPLRTFTYTLAEYRQLLASAGFERIEFFAVFPDYKLPAAIFPVADPSMANEFFLSGRTVPEHSGYEGTMLPFQPELQSLYRSLAELGIVQYFAPSYYIVAHRPEMERQEEPPFYNVDYLNALAQPLDLERMAVEAGCGLTVRGWAADRMAEGPAGGVEVILDGIPYTATYGLDRADVAASFHSDAYRRSGFDITIPAVLVKVGIHELRIRVLSGTGKVYWEGLPVLVECRQGAAPGV